MSERAKNCPAYAGYCGVHGFTHGAEAEELRKGLEVIVRKYGLPENDTHDGELIRQINALLDRVDARDSVAFLERDTRLKVHVLEGSKAGGVRIFACGKTAPRAGGPSHVGRAFVAYGKRRSEITCKGCLKRYPEVDDG